jgi:hypothetical protein
MLVTHVQSQSLAGILSHFSSPYLTNTWDYFRTDACGRSEAPELGCRLGSIPMRLACHPDLGFIAFNVGLQHPV